MLEDNPELLRSRSQKRPDQEMPKSSSMGALSALNNTMAPPLPPSTNNNATPFNNIQYSGKPQRYYEQGNKQPVKLDLYKSVGATKKEPLIEIIEKQQGTFVPKTGIPINQSLMSEGKAPLVPFSANELQKTPGIDLSRYALKKKGAAGHAHKPCTHCDCPQFAADRFRANYCINCFHFH